MNKKTVAGTQRKFDRRSGADRRQADKGPPGGRERRVHMEPRKPDVQEMDITPSDWANLSDQPPPTKTTP